MPPTDGAPAAPATPQGQGPSRGLLLLLAVVVAGGLAYWLWPAATPTAEPSNQARAARGSQGGRGTPPLNVRLEALKQPEPQPAETERNPFRFQPKAPPPLPPNPFGARGVMPGSRGAPGSPGSQPENPGPPMPPPVPPIPLKFIGIVEGRDAGKVAVFVNADGRGVPVYGREGQLILGQYRIVKIQIESVVMEYADGRGRQTIPLRGQ